ncbi:hypothetical protein Bbelb_283320 [Branchiostoma belcheri]|nr:hypothetical protein Bbelb_283320 [Branchiostoma belcheri]
MATTFASSAPFWFGESRPRGMPVKAAIRERRSDSPIPGPSQPQGKRPGKRRSDSPSPDPKVPQLEWDFAVKVPQLEWDFTVGVGAATEFQHGVIGPKGLITENCDIVFLHDSDVTSARSEERTPLKPECRGSFANDTATGVWAPSRWSAWPSDGFPTVINIPSTSKVISGAQTLPLFIVYSVIQDRQVFEESIASSLPVIWMG